VLPHCIVLLPTEACAGATSIDVHVDGYAGMLVALLVANQPAASALSTSIGSFWFVFAGFFLPRPTMPPWWVWLFYTSPVAWAVEAVYVSQLGDKARLRVACCAVPCMPARRKWRI
jgi:ABC-2 type transporter